MISNFNITGNTICEYFSNFVFDVFIGEIGYESSPQLYIAIAKFTALKYKTYIAIQSEFDFAFTLQVKFIYLKKDILLQKMDSSIFPRLLKDLIDLFIEVDYIS